MLKQGWKLFSTQISPLMPLLQEKVPSLVMSTEHPTSTRQAHIVLCSAIKVKQVLVRMILTQIRYSDKMVTVICHQIFRITFVLYITIV